MDTSQISRQLIGFLLRPPNKWTSEHIDTLSVEEKGTISAAELVGQKNLPDERDEVFQGLVRQFMEPTRDDILNFRYDKWNHPENDFSPVFHYTSYIIKPIPGDSGANSASLKDIIMRMITVCYGLEGGYGLKELWNHWGKLAFELPLFHVKGTINCSGAIGTLPLGEMSPFSPRVIYHVAKTSAEENIIKCEVPYGLVLIFDAFNRDPHCGESYLRTLCQGADLDEHLKIYRSHEFDLIDPEGRRAFLVMFMGVANYVLTQEPLEDNPG